MGTTSMHQHLNLLLLAGGEPSMRGAFKQLLIGMPSNSAHVSTRPTNDNDARFVNDIEIRVI